VDAPPAATHFNDPRSNRKAVVLAKEIDFIGSGVEFEPEVCAEIGSGERPKARH